MGYIHKFTETQRRILAVLADGERHHCDELLQKCFADRTEPSKMMVRMQLSNIRKILRIIGENIICEYWERRLYYRHIRLLSKVNGSPSPVVVAPVSSENPPDSGPSPAI